LSSVFYKEIIISAINTKDRINVVKEAALTAAPLHEPKESAVTELLHMNKPV